MMRQYISQAVFLLVVIAQLITKKLPRIQNPTYETYKKGIEHAHPSICANAVIGLIRVTCYLLTRQIQRLERDFL